jgi:acylphosphatase
VNAPAHRALVRGRVQGVGFRFATAREARRLGVVGWVRNLADGQVEVHLEGQREPVAALLTFLAQGPPGAAVSGVEVHEVEGEGAAEFRIVRG